MAAQGFFLSEGDARILKDMIQEYRRKPKVQASADLSEANDAMFAPEVYVAEIPAAGIPAMIKEGDEWIPGSATCRVRRIWPKVVTGTEIDEGKYLLEEQEFVNRTVYNIDENAIAGTVIAATGTGTSSGTGDDWQGSEKFHLICRDKWGKWVIQRKPTQLVELCAQENAERNVPYECLLGTWNPDTALWCYDDAETVWAIDHRKGAPYAEVGWKGLYQEMSSNNEAHGGKIYICVSLDCETPEEGCNECNTTGTGS